MDPPLNGKDLIEISLFSKFGSYSPFSFSADVALGITGYERIRQA
jgi:hypothetical protein